MSALFELTVIASFWVTLFLGWSITLYERRPEDAPEWWLYLRETWAGGVIYILCASILVFPLLALFFIDT